MKRRSVLMLSTVLGMVVSYLPTYLLSPSQHSNTDCSLYKLGEGLDQEGQPFQDFSSFYPYYVCEHLNPRTKLFHFVASFNVIALVLSMIFDSGLRVTTILLGLIQGYGLAWFSHFFIEQNKPATFQYPVWSFLSDYKMMSEVLSGEYVVWE